MKNIREFFDQEEARMLVQADKLHDALTHLRYEGLPHKTRNIEATRKAIKKLDDMLQRHRLIQERVVFPFLQTHIPRHEAAIHFLETEHEDIKKNERKLKADLRNLSSDHDVLNRGKIYERGICLVSLLRHHIGFENRNIRRSIEKDLRGDEKKAISLRLAGWLRKSARAPRKSEP